MLDFMWLGIKCRILEMISACDGEMQSRNPAQSTFNLAVLTQIMLHGILSTTSVFCALRRSAFYCPLSSFLVASCRLPTLKSYLTHTSVSFKGSAFVCKQTSSTVLHFFPPPELSCSVVSSSSSSSCATVELCACARTRWRQCVCALAPVC